MLQRHIHRMFAVGVTLKGLHALVELIMGAAILTISPVGTSNFFLVLAEREQARGWPPFIVDFLLGLARAALEGGQRFAGIYLLVVGLINVGLVIGLLTGALWSYPAALAALVSLMVYQLYRYTHTHALALILLTLFDAVVCWLVWQEYCFLREAAETRRRSSYGNAV